MNLEILLITTILIAISFLALGFNIFFRRKKFPATSVGKNKEMAKRNIYCVKGEEIKKHRRKVKINPTKLKVIPD